MNSWMSRAVGKSCRIKVEDWIGGKERARSGAELEECS